MEYFHRIGGGGVANLRLKPSESRLDPPGISVLKGKSSADAAAQMKEEFPSAGQLHSLAKLVGSATEEAIRSAGFDVLPDPTRRFPNHYRIIHLGGSSGFTDENLRELSQAFVNVKLEE